MSTSLPTTEPPPCRCRPLDPWPPGATIPCSQFNLNQTEYAWRVCSCQGTEALPVSEETSKRFRIKWAKKYRGDNNSSPALRKRRIAQMKAKAKRPKSPPRKPPKPKLHCIHLGQATGEQKECKSCNKTLSYHSVYTCTLHGNCTLTRSFEPLACCKTCGNYEAKEIVNGQ